MPPNTTLHLDPATMQIVASGGVEVDTTRRAPLTRFQAPELRRLYFNLSGFAIEVEDYGALVQATQALLDRVRLSRG